MLTADYLPFSAKSALLTADYLPFSARSDFLRGTLPGKTPSGYLQRPIASARFPLNFSTLPKYTPDLAEPPLPPGGPPTSPNPHLPLTGPQTLPTSHPRHTRPPILPTSHLLLPALPTLLDPHFLPVPLRPCLILISCRRLPPSTLPNSPTRSWSPLYSFPGVCPTFSGSHCGPGQRFGPIVVQMSSLSGLCRGSGGTFAPGTVLTVLS